jgi:hypothetical protein
VIAISNILIVLYATDMCFRPDYGRVAECNPTVTTWYFTGSPDYLLMRKFSSKYNVALSFTWLLTEQQRFFKCTVKFGLPEDFEHGGGFWLKTDPLKKSTAGLTQTRPPVTCGKC